MNPLAQLNAFWEKVETTTPLKPRAIAVYMALMQINNRCGWKETFSVDYGQVMHMAGMTKNTYYEGVKDLVVGGFVNYKAGPNQYVSADFQIILLNRNLVKQRERNRSSRGNATGQAEGTQQERIGNIPKQLNSKITKHLNNILLPHERAALENEQHIESENQKMTEHWRNSEPEEKEKNCAKKENYFPTCPDALAGVKLTSWYTSAARLYQAGEEDDREAEFEVFFEQQEDEYRKITDHGRAIAWPEMAKHFHHWLDIRLSIKRKRQKQESNADTASQKRNGHANKTVTAPANGYGAP